MSIQMLEFNCRDNDLHITLTEEGRERLPDLIEQYGQDDYQILRELMEHQFCNGWKESQAEEYGFLTDSFLVTSHLTGAIYYYPDYMTDDAVGFLKTKNGLLMKKIDTEPDFSVEEIVQYLRKHHVEIDGFDEPNAERDGEIRLFHNIRIQVGTNYALVNKVDGNEITLGEVRYTFQEILSDVQKAIPSIKIWNPES